jgi:hypothetical protein
MSCELLASMIVGMSGAAGFRLRPRLRQFFELYLPGMAMMPSTAARRRISNLVRSRATNRRRPVKMSGTRARVKTCPELIMLRVNRQAKPV